MLQCFQLEPVFRFTIKKSTVSDIIKVEMTVITKRRKCERTLLCLSPR